MLGERNSYSAFSGDERLAIERASREMDRLGCQITTIHKEPGASGRWQAHWRARDPSLQAISYGASGSTASAAAWTAVANALSDLVN
jgi:hypothetical protein